MSMVKFAVICDHCGARSEEYGAWPACVLCIEDVCLACAVPGSHDEESGRAKCLRCAAEDLGGSEAVRPCADLEAATLARYVNQLAAITRANAEDGEQPNEREAA